MLSQTEHYIWDKGKYCNLLLLDVDRAVYIIYGKSFQAHILPHRIVTYGGNNTNYVEQG